MGEYTTPGFLTHMFRQAEFCAAEGYSVAFVSPYVANDASVTAAINMPTQQIDR
jgi:hypothetical protein